MALQTYWRHHGTDRNSGHTWEGRCTIVMTVEQTVISEHPGLFSGRTHRNLFEGTKFLKSKNKIINKSSVSKFEKFSKLAHYLRPSR
jgi:murein tripeptide amidase MpaA